MSSRWALSGTTPVDANGKPSAVLGTLTFYATGTTTKQDAYSDAGNSSALANPYTLGSDGKIPDVFLGLLRYKIVLLDSTGATIETWDPVDKSLERIKSAGKPSPCYAGLQYWDTNDDHLKEIGSDGTTVIDRGGIDSQINAASVADQLTGTSTSLSSTPASVGGLWLAGTCSISANNISLPSTGGGVFTCATSTTTLTTISSTTEGRVIRVIFSNAQTITHGSGINVPGSLTTKIPAGCEVTFRRGSSDWTILHWTTGPFFGRSGARNTVVTTASNTTVGITADTAICESTAGLGYRHSSVSVTINMAVTGANGLDTGSQTTAFYYLWLISDGTTVAGLASTSSSSPTMPSGYTYKLRVGAIHSTLAVFDAVKGYGNRFYYTGGCQSISSTNNLSNASTSISSLVPATARYATIVLNCASDASGGCGASPNSSYGTTLNSATATPPYLTASGGASAQEGQATGDVPLETAQTIYLTTGSSGTNRVLLAGWVDACAVS